MAKKSEVGQLFFKPATGFSVHDREEGEWVKLGDIIITDGLAKELFGEDDEKEDTDDEDSITITGRNIRTT